MSNETDAIRETVAEWLRFNADRIVSGEYVDDLPDEPSPNGGGKSDDDGDAAPAKLDHGLAWEAIMALALADQLALHFSPPGSDRWPGTMIREFAAVRHRIEDHIGIEKDLSDQIVSNASKRFEEMKGGAS